MSGVKIVTPIEQKYLALFPADLRIFRQSRSRRTRTLLVAGEAPEKFAYQKAGLQFNGGDGNWVIICVTHRQFKRVLTRDKAYRASCDPECFCHKCNDFTSGIGVRFQEPPPKFD